MQGVQTRSERVQTYSAMDRTALAEAAHSALRTADYADEVGEAALHELALERLAAIDEALPAGEDAATVAQEVPADE